MRSALLVCLSVASMSFAAKFEPIPADAKGSQSGLELKVVKYDGATNGTITVEVHNPTKAAASFDAQGLFFVPDMNPDQAPQRLGAVGAFAVNGQQNRQEKLAIEPGASATLALDVYCIDSHRPSPSSTTPFRLSKDRMPRELAHDIDANTKEAAKSYGGVSAPAAKAAVQSEVWNSRNKKWIKLDGEGKQEAAK